MSKFTVKWINVFDGVEKTRLFSADNVEVFYPNTMVLKSLKSGLKHHDYDVTGPCLFIDAGPGGQGFKLAEGRVFVMNSDGKTIGSYVLTQQ